MEYVPSGPQTKRRSNNLSDKNIVEKAADVVGNLTKFQKQSKLQAAYLEREEFRTSDLHKGYFCYNCIYFMKPNHCAIVTDEGQDLYGKVSNEIAPYGICSLWTPNEKEIK